ncbi:hypothetical protein CDAR_68971, partial [Caerostris darwini]
MPAEKCVEGLKSKLAKQGLSLKEDIISRMADGATVMKEVGKLIGANQQLCYAHGIPLGPLKEQHTSLSEELYITLKNRIERHTEIENVL